MTDQPRLLVIVPALNEAKLIARCLASLGSQTIDARLYRVVVCVDSRSTDETVAICETFPCTTLIDDKYHTIGGAAFLASENMREDIVACTEADCVVASDWVEKIIDAFDARPTLAGLTGPVLAEVGSSLSDRVSFHLMYTINRALGILLRRAYYPGMNFAYRRRFFDEAGGFNPSISAGWDNDTSIRVSKVSNDLQFRRDIKVWTSTRRLRAGLFRNVCDYGSIMIRVTLKMPTRKPKDIRL